MVGADPRNLFLLIVAGSGVVAMSFVAPIPQDPAYHEFADQRTLLGVPNFWNVFTNLPFGLVGVYGLAAKHRLHPSVSGTAFTTLCIGVFLVAVGSSYYHIDPSTATLFWDRLPMTIAFMALFSIVVGDRISRRLGDTLLWPLVAVGIASAAYWYWTELQGQGDLRMYVLVQFLPMLLIPLLLGLYRGKGINAIWLWSTLGIYVHAKIAEHFDHFFYEIAWLSGHSLKHLLASLAVFLVLLAVFLVPQTDRQRVTGIRLPGSGEHVP
ncbi:MAG: ceramidase [Gammaproteobacteria bacterium]|nr:ceramidase [Gammaproteobacteria bacterium]